MSPRCGLEFGIIIQRDGRIMGERERKTWSSRMVERILFKSFETNGKEGPSNSFPENPNIIQFYWVPQNFPGAPECLHANFLDFLRRSPRKFSWNFQTQQTKLQYLLYPYSDLDELGVVLILTTRQEYIHRNGKYQLRSKIHKGKVQTPL